METGYSASHLRPYLVDGVDRTSTNWGFSPWAFLPESLKTQGTIKRLNALEQALKDPRLRKATREMGQSRLDLATLPYSSPILDTGMQAWSSWWYPKQARDFIGPKEAFKTPILEKYDKFFNIKDPAKSALAWELNAEGNRSHSSWEGLCDAWAIASIVHAEPVKPVSFEISKPVDGPKPKPGAPPAQPQVDKQKITMSIMDLKGLLLKTYEAVPEDQFEFYGEKFLASAEGWIHPDIFPEQFHRLIEMYIGELKKPLVMDRDPGVEVWSIPIYKANYKIEAAPGRPNAVLVRMYLYTAGPVELDNRDFVGTKEVVREYHYMLTGDLDASGRYLNVSGGEWLKTERIDSRVNHPDFIFVPKAKKVKRVSYNPNIDIKRIDQILMGSFATPPQQGNARPK